MIIEEMREVNLFGEVGPPRTIQTWDILLDDRLFRLFIQFGINDGYENSKAFRILVCRRVQRYLNNKNIPSQILTHWDYNFQGKRVFDEVSLSRSYEEEVKHAYDNSEGSKFINPYASHEIYIKNNFTDNQEILYRCEFNKYRGGKKHVFSLHAKPPELSPPESSAEQRQRIITILQAFEDAITFLLEVKSITKYDIIPLLAPLSGLTRFEVEEPQEASAEESQPPTQMRRLDGLSQSRKLDALNILALREMMRLPREARGRHDATPKQMLDNLKLILNN